MAKSSPKKLAFQKAYNARPEEVAKRVKNNAARREAIASGRAKVGDGKDIGHKMPLEVGGGNAAGNLEVQSRKENRGWRRGQSGYTPKAKR
jgi:hypothetical protein